MFSPKTLTAITFSVLAIIFVYPTQNSAEVNMASLPLITSSEYGQFRAMRTENEIYFSVSYNNLPDKIKRITLQTFSGGGEEILVTVCGDIAEPSITENYCPDEPALFNGTITPDNLTSHTDEDAYFTFERLSDAIEKQLVVLKLEIKIN